MYLDDMSGQEVLIMLLMNSYMIAKLLIMPRTSDHANTIAKLLIMPRTC